MPKTKLCELNCGVISLAFEDTESWVNYKKSIKRLTRKKGN